MIVLAGERVKWNSGPKPASAEDILSTASRILRSKVVDLMSTGELIRVTQKRIPEYLARKPVAVIIFSGAADEKARTDEEAQSDTLTTIGQTIASAGIRVYFVPSAVSVSASVTANLRIAASASDTTYVDPGSEFGGRPYEEALNEIANIENRARAASVVLPEGTSSSLTVQGPAATPTTIYIAPPPALKSFDPKEDMGNKPKSSRKVPAAAP